MRPRRALRGSRPPCPDRERPRRWKSRSSKPSNVGRNASVCSGLSPSPNPRSSFCRRARRRLSACRCGRGRSERLRPRVEDPDLDVELVRLLYSAGELEEAAVELEGVRRRWGSLRVADELALAITAGDPDANDRALKAARRRAPVGPRTPEPGVAPGRDSVLSSPIGCPSTRSSLASRRRRWGRCGAAARSGGGAGL